MLRLRIKNPFKSKYLCLSLSNLKAIVIILNAFLAVHLAAFVLPSFFAALLPRFARLAELASLRVHLPHSSRQETHMPPRSPIGNPAPCTHTAAMARTHTHTQDRKSHAIAFEMKQKFNESWQGAKSKTKTKSRDSATASVSRGKLSKSEPQGAAARRQFLSSWVPKFLSSWVPEFLSFSAGRRVQLDPRIRLETYSYVQQSTTNSTITTRSMDY